MYATQQQQQQQHYPQSYHEGSMLSRKQSVTNSFAGSAPTVAGDPARWSTYEVSSWVLENGFGTTQTVELMKDQDIDGRALLLLTPEDIEKTLKVTKLGQRLKLHDAITSLKRASSELLSPPAAAAAAENRMSSATTGSAADALLGASLT
ncbi:hypothetical protein BDR26DRAFT_222338 [Obelidium mucronatum]|nr:hypothetical protein BDR26DRAFT_222338 [Obelidium mucronatum]